MEKTPEIWIFAEKRLAAIEPTTFQLITKAKAVAPNFKTVAVLLETPEENLEESLKEYGPDKILVIKDTRLNQPADSEQADLLAQLAKRYQPNSFLFGATITGRSIAPRLQAKLQTGLTADCLDLYFEEEQLVQVKPSYGDNIMCEILCPDRRPQMATVRPNTFTAKKAAGKVDVEIVEDLEFHPSAGITIEAEHVILSNSDNIANAKRVIALGRGAADDQSIQLAEELAGKLGAKVGVSRPLTDKPQFNVDDQIGQSGNTIAPSFLINLGISGAVQYVSGIENTDIIVSVNTDKQAPIFKVSDYCFLGDAKTFLTELGHAVK